MSNWFQRMLDRFCISKEEMEMRRDQLGFEHWKGYRW